MFLVYESTEDLRARKHNIDTRVFEGELNAKTNLFFSESIGIVA